MKLIMNDSNGRRPHPHASGPLYPNSHIIINEWEFELRCWRGEAEHVRRLLQRRCFLTLISSHFDSLLDFAIVSRLASRPGGMAGNQGGGGTSGEDRPDWFGLTWPVGEAVRIDSQALYTINFTSGDHTDEICEVRETLGAWLAAASLSKRASAIINRLRASSWAFPAVRLEPFGTNERELTEGVLEAYLRRHYWRARQREEPIRRD